MPSRKQPELTLGVDYYLEEGKLVFTAAHHLKRGFCCNSRCRHCPYRADPNFETVLVVGLPTEPSRDE